MKIYWRFLLSAIILLVFFGCKKDEETEPEQISIGQPVTTEMYKFLKGEWTYKNPPKEWNWSNRTKFNFIDDTLVYIYNDAGSPTTNTYRYSLVQHNAVNGLIYWSRTDTIATKYEDYFVIKDKSIWLGGLQGLEMIKKAN